MSEAINKHSRMPRKLSRRTLRKREELAMGGVHALAEVNPQALVQRYLAGEKIRNMAKQYGVQPVSIYAFLLRNCPDEWMAAQKAAAFAKKEAGEDGLDDASDPLDVAIAREKLRAGQWDLERVDRKNYGRDDQNITINMVDLGDRLRRSRERLMETIDTHQAIEQGNENPARVEHMRGRELAVIDGGSQAEEAGNGVSDTQQRSAA